METKNKKEFLKSLDVMAALAAPFEREDVKWRVGSLSAARDKGFPLAYIPAEAVKERLNTVLGIENWSVEYTPVVSNGFVMGMMCKLTITVNGQVVSKEDVGVPTNEHDLLKTASADALKRAAVNLGVGAYLYSMKSSYMPVNERGFLVNNPILPESMTLAGFARSEGVALEKDAVEQEFGIPPDLSAQSVQAVNKAAPVTQEAVAGGYIMPQTEIQQMPISQEPVMVQQPVNAAGIHQQVVTDFTPVQANVVHTEQLNPTKAVPEGIVVEEPAQGVQGGHVSVQAEPQNVPNTPPTFRKPTGSWEQGKQPKLG